MTSRALLSRYYIPEQNLEVLDVFEERERSIVHFGYLKILKSNYQKSEKGKKRLEVLVKSALCSTDNVHRVLIADEFRVLIQIQNHPNILACGGFVVNRRGMQFITEYLAGGTLLDFLKSFRDQKSFQNCLISSEVEEDGFVILDTEDTSNYSNPAKLSTNLESLSTFDLLSIAYQIAFGMKYLASFKMVHYNLSLQNVYITKNQTIRFGELGMARSCATSEYNEKVFKFSAQSLCAPEVSSNYEFSEKSDVWSFGICLYQIFTLGGDLSGEDVFERNLKQPEYCHREIFKFILTCLSTDPSERPTFSKCVEFCERHMDRYTPQIRVQIDRKLEEARRSHEELRNWIVDDDDESEYNFYRSFFFSWSEKLKEKLD